MVESVNSSVAMKLVGLDRNRFNQAVADGYYDCAPFARSGARRNFSISDLVALWFFARETEIGVPARLAGDLACRILGMVQSWPEENRICLGQGVNGLSWFLPESRADIANREIAPARGYFPGRMSDPEAIAQIRIFDVGNVRALLLQKIADQEKVASGGEE